MGFEFKRIAPPGLVQPGLEKRMECAICQLIVKDPVALSPCDHVFCRECLQDYYDQVPDVPENFQAPLPGFQCPLDRQIITEWKKPSQSFMQFYDLLRIYCIWRDYGCNEAFPAEHVEVWKNHEDSCQFNMSNVATTCGKCGYEGPKVVVNEHHSIVREHDDNECVNVLRHKLDRKNSIIQFLKSEVDYLKTHNELLSQIKENHAEDMKKLREELKKDSANYYKKIREEMDNFFLLKECIVGEVGYIKLAEISARYQREKEKREGQKGGPLTPPLKQYNMEEDPKTIERNGFRKDRGGGDEPDSSPTGSMAS